MTEGEKKRLAELEALLRIAVVWDKMPWDWMARARAVLEDKP